QSQASVRLLVVYFGRSDQILHLQRLLIVGRLAERIGAHKERRIPWLQKPRTEGGGAEHGERRDADEARQRGTVVSQFFAHQSAQWGELNGAQWLVASAEMES